MITHRSDQYSIDCVILFPNVYSPARYPTPTKRYGVTFHDQFGCKHRASSYLPPIVKGNTDGLIETLEAARAHNVEPDRLLSGVRAMLLVRDISFENMRCGQKIEGQFIGLDSLTVAVFEMREILEALVNPAFVG